VGEEEKNLVLQQHRDGKKDICMACYDLQKVLQCPRSQVGTFYYKNKLSLYNSTIFTVALLWGLCCVWNQTEAKRGSNEIATNVFVYIKRMAREGYKRMSLYSDNCSGQNKNRDIFCM